MVTESQGSPFLRSLIQSFISDVIRDTALHSLYQLSQLCVLITHCPPPVYLLGDRVRKKESTSAMCKHYSAIAKHWCAFSTILATNLKHSTAQAAEKKPTSIPDKDRREIEHLRFVMRQNDPLFLVSIHKLIQAQQQPE